MQAKTYQSIPASELPLNLRFDTPGRCQGQHVEVSYADYQSKYEADEGSLYKRIVDHGDQSKEYFILR